MLLVFLCQHGMDILRDRFLQIRGIFALLRLKMPIIISEMITKLRDIDKYQSRIFVAGAVFDQPVKRCL